MLESIISARCPHCKGPGPLRHGLCPDCRTRWTGWHPENRCSVCSTEIRGAGTICQRCLEASDRFDRAFFLVPYGESARSWLHHVKFRDRLEWLDLIPDLADFWTAVVSDWKPEAVSWIPSAPVTWWRRGYNVSHEIAKRVSARLGIPMVRLLRPGTLYKRPLSASRDPAHRHRIIRRFLKPVPNAPTLKRVLLVDDVFTTGATLNRASGIVRKSTGAKDVSVFTLMRVLPDSDDLG